MLTVRNLQDNARRAAKIICDSEYYDEDYLVDFELLACIINDILTHVCKKKMLNCVF